VKSTERQELGASGEQAKDAMIGSLWSMVDRALFETEFRLKVFGTYCSVAACVAPAGPKNL